jgi:hypothetical protein
MRRYRTWLWAVGRLLLGLTLTCCSARAAEPAKATFWDFETSTNAWSPTEGIRGAVKGAGVFTPVVSARGRPRGGRVDATNPAAGAAERGPYRPISVGRKHHG